MEYNLNRYKNITKKPYELEVVTPLFLGGADPTQGEIRSASLKGLFRFWWRAIYGPTICEPYIKNGEYEKGLQELKKKEEELFGSQNKKSIVSLSLNIEENTKPICERLSKGKIYIAKTSKGEFKLGIIDYLAYGLNTYDKTLKDNRYIRTYFAPGTKLNLTIEYPEKEENNVIPVLKALVSFGGLGAKTRNGFGSLFNRELTISWEDFRKNRCTHINRLIPYTSFSNQSKLIPFPRRNSWEEALSEIGIAYKDARLSLEKKHVYTKRGLIGRPIVQAEATEIKNQRHAKPFFLHVCKDNKDKIKYQGQILYLPYEYYDSEQRQKYYDVCEEMVKKIEKKAKEGSKQ